MQVDAHDSCNLLTSVQLSKLRNCSNGEDKPMKFNTLLYFMMHLRTFCAALLLVSLPHLLWSQCATFGAFDIGEDAEITCEDSCLTLVSPSIATVASGGTEYEVEEIEYALPYPFNQGSVAINTGTTYTAPSFRWALPLSSLATITPSAAFPATAGFPSTSLKQLVTTPTAPTPIRICRTTA